MKKRPQGTGSISRTVDGRFRPRLPRAHGRRYLEVCETEEEARQQLEAALRPNGGRTPKPIDPAWINDSVRVRFWDKVDVIDDEACWLWNAATNSRGYGSFGLRGRVLSAHRVAYVIVHGCDVPTGDVIRHLCHRKSCVNPAHLATGSHADNAQDTVHAGLSSRGVSNPRAKLTDDMVREMRQRVADGETFASVSRDFGVSFVTARDICLGRLWRHVK